jgi:hypothetical protein
VVFRLALVREDNAFKKLPVVSSRKQFMETLGDMMVAQQEGELGRPRELKSYILDSNSSLSPNFGSNELSGTIKGTGVDQIKIINLRFGERYASFYLDLSDERFWTLHTSERANEAHSFVKHFTSTPEFQLDRAWIPREMLETISHLPGNAFNGVRLKYLDLFTPSDITDRPIEELRLSVYGTMANRALNAIEKQEGLEHSISYEKVGVKRGSEKEFAKDDVSYNGTFAVKSGTSADDHVSLIDDTRSRYKKVVESIEDSRLGVSGTGDSKRLKGKAFNFTFERKIEDFDFFLNRMFNSQSPFRLWGVKSKLEQDFYQVLSIDMHTGHPIDIEISSDFMRVYLPDGSCGNTVLRLYVNLQHYFDSEIRCRDIFPHGAN